MTAERWRVELGDCLAVLERMPAESVDAVVTDPPYGLSAEPDMAEVLKHWLAGDDYVHRGGGFMGQSWDSFVPGPSVWREVMRVLKPGGHVLAFFGARTYDMGTIALRLAGFEIRDRILTLNGHTIGAEVDWLYGAGWPKSRNIGKAIDARAGAEREVIGTKVGQPGYSLAESKGGAVYGNGIGGTGDPEREAEVTAPATPEAEQWEGWGTALKPAHEPIVVARKPFRGTVEAQVLATGTGAINIDACRIAMNGEQLAEARSDPANRRGVVGAELQAPSDADRNAEAQAESIARANRLGRWPANVALVHAPGCQRVGERRITASTSVRRNAKDGDRNGVIFEKRAATGEDMTYGDADGMETVEAWECEPGCPVATLDDLSGELASGDPTAVGDPLRRNGQNAYMGESRPEGTPIVGYGDRGGASRFFAGFHVSPGEATVGTCEPASATAAPTPSSPDDESAGSAPSPAPPERSPAPGCPAPSTPATPSASRRPLASVTPIRSSTHARLPEPLHDALTRARSHARSAAIPTPTATTTTTTSPSASDGSAEAVTSASTSPNSEAGDPACAPSQRVFYSGKASPVEREAGLHDLPVAGRTDDHYGTMQTPQLDRAAPRENWTPREIRNVHPTVKPIDLMRWLIRLVAPPGAVVLDPFAGSCSTGCAAVLEGVRFVGIERDEQFATIGRARVGYWASFPVGTPVDRVLAQENARRRGTDEAQERRRELAAAGQLDLLASAEEPHA